MDRMEMVEKLREKANITLEEARDVLEKNNWDMLDACVELEKSGKIQDAAKASTEKKDADEYEEVNPTFTGESYKNPKEGKPVRRLREAIRSVIRVGIDNKFVVKRADEVLIRVPVIVPALCLICKFWISAIVLFVGLVFGLKYSFEGKELGTEKINNTVEKATEAASDFVNNLKEGHKEEAMKETAEEAAKEEVKEEINAEE